MHIHLDATRASSLTLPPPSPSPAPSILSNGLGVIILQATLLLSSSPRLAIGSVMPHQHLHADLQYLHSSPFPQFYLQHSPNHSATQHLHTYLQHPRPSASKQLQPPTTTSPHFDAPRHHHKRTNERTNERTNKRTNERTNERTTTTTTTTTTTRTTFNTL